MALSGSKTGSVTNKSNYFTFYFEWSATQDIAGNYSDVTVKTYVKTNNTYQTFDTVGSRDHSITINGDTTEISKVIDCDPWNSDGVYHIQTKTTRVYHDADGKKKITISARSNGHALEWGYSSSTASSADATASAEITLDTIPRASSITSISNDGMVINGSNELIVNISRASSSFTHDVKFTFGDYTHTLTSQGTSAKFIVPLTWIARFGNGGSGSLKGSVSVQTKNGSNNIGSAVSKDITLKCPSASTFASTAKIECNGSNNIAIAISRAVSTFTHTIKWVWGSYNHTITKTSGVSLSYAPPTSWLSAIPNANSGHGTIYVETYYGNQKIGATASARFDMTVPSYTPSLTSVNATLVQNSKISDWNIYVEKYSKAKFTFNGASGVYGSTIKEYKVVVDSVTYKGTANNYTSNALNKSGELEWTATITDSRGYYTSKTGKINVQALIVPKYVSHKIYRYDGAKENDSGEQLFFNLTFTYGEYGGLNSTTNKIYIKRSGASQYTEYGTFENGEDLKIDDYVFDYHYSYAIRAIVTDELGNSIQVDKTILDDRGLIDSDGVNNSVGLLKLATRPNFVQVGGHLEVDGMIVNPQGSYNHVVTANGQGNYIKFATIKIVGNYADTRISFDILNRTGYEKTSVLLYFGGGATTDPVLSRLAVRGTNMYVYAHKSATSTWDLYIYDSWGWDRYTICNLCSPDTLNPLTSSTQFLDYFNFDWVNEVASELPSDAVEGSIDYYFDTTSHRFNKNVIVGTDTSRTFISNGAIELYAGIPYIDFHFGGASDDFTARVAETEKGVITIYNYLKVPKSINGVYIQKVQTDEKTTIKFNVDTHVSGFIFGDYNNTASAYVFGRSTCAKLAGGGSISVADGVVTLTVSAWSYFTFMSNAQLTFTLS